MRSSAGLPCCLELQVNKVRQYLGSRWRSHEVRPRWWGRVRCCMTEVGLWGKVGFQGRREAESGKVLLVGELVQGKWHKWSAVLSHLIKVFQEALGPAVSTRVGDWLEWESAALA